MSTPANTPRTSVVRRTSSDPFALGSPAPSTPPAQHVVANRASGTLSGGTVGAPRAM